MHVERLLEVEELTFGRTELESIDLEGLGVAWRQSRIVVFEERIRIGFRVGV